MCKHARFLHAAAAGLAIAILVGCSGEKEAARKAVKPVPDVYRAVFDTSKGRFVVEVIKSWAPEGAERFYRLIEQKFYDDARFFRVLPNFVAQFGINGDPKVSARWRNLTIPDDPVTQSNKRGTLAFAMAGPNTRTTQVFINLADNERLDDAGFAPFGRVVEGMEVVDKFYDSYRDGPPRGTGPDQTLIEKFGNEYLNSKFPRLDYIITARIQEE
ncbi:MAG TPA: peptidylprolyl isomerase [Bryobacteraceae bacterium]|nr:peptidylprolyl isomerase [Bryobacteraceae bacterium]HPU71654.1 peptidylprolyl isomerase [Bryobacteraceae bacterium]